MLRNFEMSQTLGDGRKTPLTKAVAGQRVDIPNIKVADGVEPSKLALFFYAHVSRGGKSGYAQRVYEQ